MRTAAETPKKHAASMRTSSAFGLSAPLRSTRGVGCIASLRWTKSCLAFFEVPGRPFDFKRQDTLDRHIALGVEPDVFDRMLEKARSEGVEVRGPVDHGFVRSIYMRDPNGYVVELTASTGVWQEIMDPAISKPHEALARWQATKAGQATPIRTAA